MSPIDRTGGRIKTMIATVAVTTVAVAGAALGTVVTTNSGGGGDAVTANIWVDTTGGTCADSGSLVAYPSDGTECATLGAAVAAAEPGDTIGIRAGVYPFDTISRKQSLEDLSPGCDPYGEWGAASTTNCVHIIPDGDVTFRGFLNNASSLWIDGEDAGPCSSVATCDARTFNFHSTNTDLIGNPPAGAATNGACNCKSVESTLARSSSSSDPTTQPDHVIADSIDVDTISTLSANHVMLRNSDVGPMWFDTTANGSGNRGPAVPRVWENGTAGAPSDVVYDGVFFHEMNRTLWCDTNNYCHPDGLFVNATDSLTIRNSGFSQIAGEVLFFQNFGQPDNIEGVTVENSWFGCKVNSYPDDPANARTTCGSGTPFSISECGPGGCVNWLVRFNAWVGIDSASEATWSNGRFVGNAGRQPGSTDPICTANAWNYNAFYTNTGGSNCGATNASTGSSSAGSLFVNTTPGQEDFHLVGSAGSTTADNLVSPTTSDYALGKDVDQETRPVDTNRDSGVDER